MLLACSCERSVRIRCVGYAAVCFFNVYPTVGFLFNLCLCCFSRWRNWQFPVSTMQFILKRITNYPVTRLKKKVCECSVSLFWPKLEVARRFSETAGAAGSRKMVVNGMASCFTILQQITRLKCVGPEVSSSAFTLKRIPSNGSMAPCQTNHGDHTR